VARASAAPRFVALSTGPERRLRPVATWALGRLGGAAAVSQLRRLLEDPDPAVRGYAALGLGRAADRPSVGAL